MIKITLVPGDGIGPEIAKSVQQVFAAIEVPIEWEVHQAGLETYEKKGKLIPADMLESIEKNKIALKGPTTTPIGTGHRSINVYLRQHFNLYANVRPVRKISGVDAIHDDVDLIIVRENTEDLYKGIEYKVNENVAHGIKLITRDASERIGRFAFDLAGKLGRKKVTAVHKANIMKYTDGLFLQSIVDVSKEFEEIEMNDCIVDNCCMQLVRNPGQFDVIVTENLYGDILSDLSTGLVGGLGVAAGSNIGDEMAIFEPVHGSAPDIAGKNLANPTAILLSAVQMLEYLEMNDYAEQIKFGLYRCLENAETRTRDLGGQLSTTEFTDAICKHF